MKPVILAAAILTAVPAAAGEYEQKMEAFDLGQVVGKAEACGLTINEKALVDYMRSHGLLAVDLASHFEATRATYSGSKKMTPAGCAAVKAAVAEAGLS